MKIGIVCPYNLFRAGGVQEYVKALQTELKRRGHQAKIITPHPRKFDGNVPKDVILVGQSTNFNTPLHTMVDVGMSFDSEALDDLLAREDFDLLNIHEPEVPMLGIQILGRANCPTIGTFHARLPDTAMGRAIERARMPYGRSIFKQIDCLVAVSEVAGDYVKEQSGREVLIIPDGIDLKKYKNASRSSAGPAETADVKTVLYVGRLEKRKGVKYLLTAFRELSQHVPDVRLVIVGEGPERRRLQEEVAEAGPQNVEFMGYVSEAEKLRMLKEADVFCSPAPYGESFGIVLLEAMAMGVPTVAGDNPGYSAVLKERGLLSLVNPKDELDFARRLEAFLTDDALRAMWRKWAAQYVKQFSYPVIVDQYEKLFTEVLDQA